MGWDPGQALAALPSPTQSFSPLAFWLLSSWGASVVGHGCVLQGTLPGAGFLEGQPGWRD